MLYYLSNHLNRIGHDRRYPGLFPVLLYDSCTAGRAFARVYVVAQLVSRDIHAVPFGTACVLDISHNVCYFHVLEPLSFL